MKPKKLAILISGRGSNMKALVDACTKGSLKGVAKVAIVLSNNPDAEGLEVAKRMGVPTTAISSKDKTRLAFDRVVLKFLKEIGVDYVILAGFMRKLTKEFTVAYPKRIINIHPADTRSHRGLGAYEWAWENKLEKTKITVHYVNAQIDDGEIIAQADVDLKGVKNLHEVEARGLAIEHSFFAQAIKKILTDTQTKKI